jgi:hypothetical protein
MLRYAKILEYDDHQFLVRACNNLYVALGDDSGEPATILTIDIETPDGASSRTLRMILRYDDWEQVLQCLENFEESSCFEVLQVLLDVRAGVLTQEMATTAVERIQQLLLLDQL